MKHLLLVLLILSGTVMHALAADTAASKAPAPPARSKVDPALEAEHTKDDIKRHRQMAAAPEAAAKCQESGNTERTQEAYGLGRDVTEPDGSHNAVPRLSS